MQYFGFDRPSFGIKTYGFGVNEFSPLDLFAGGKQGAWYDPSDKSTLFQDAAGTVPVTLDGDPVSKVLDKSGNNNHAIQTVSAARPVYKDNPARLSLDKVDDAIVINLPSRLVGTMTLASTTGTATYGVDIPSGNFTIGGSYLSSDNIVGLLLREGELSADDESKVGYYLLSKGAVKSFAETTNFRAAWRDNNLTSFPLIDTSSGTDFSTTWYNNKLTSFPLLDTSSGTNFHSAWRDNNLTSFPLIDTSSGAIFHFAWYNNNSLVDFPAHIFDNVKGGNFTLAFTNTNLSQSSIDGILVSLVTSGIASGIRVFNQSGGSAPSTTGQAAIDTLRSRGWTVTVTGGVLV